MSTKIQVVDDEGQFRSSLARSLRGHAYEISESATAGDAVNDYAYFNPDVVLLDLMLPDGDGISVCRELRDHQAKAAIIVLTVLGDEVTKVQALDAGADDYLTKPFGTDELLARIRAVLRRTTFTSFSESKDGALKIDLEQRLVYVDGQEVRLTPTEFSLLEYLATNSGRILRHHAILTSVWGDRYADDTDVLRTYMKQLRAKLKDSRARPRFIRTEAGVGYRFIADLA
jgi:two-component system KDP operon response regulator KdpE